MCRPKNCFLPFAIICKRDALQYLRLDHHALQYNASQNSAIHSTVPMYNMVQYSTILSNIHNIVQYSTISYDIPRYRAILHLHCTIGCWASGEIKDYDEKTKSTDVSAFHNSTSATTHVCKVLLQASCIYHLQSSLREEYFAKFRGGTVHHIFCRVYTTRHSAGCVLLSIDQKRLPRVNIQCW